MNSRTLASALAVFAGLCSHTWAWGYQGHELVGSIADHLLNENAKQQVAAILGFSLREAGPWADCVRSVKNEGASFKYDPAKPEYRIPCTPFETAEEKSRMEDYVARNWSNCTVNGKKENCHTAYHYTDVAIQHDHYDSAYKGTSDHDIVGAINAAIHVLKDQPPPPPFSIRDKKEALFLLAHFIGDLHQPLHVGSIYLDADGKPANPDAGSTDKAINTAGGNDLLDEQTNLHTEWDAIPLKFGVSADPVMLKAARAVPPTPGPVKEFAASWATDTIMAAHEAFAGLRFSAVEPFDPGRPVWRVHFDDEGTYHHAAKALKRGQLAKAGARLAELLNAIWP